ncbi:hypothetical protein A6J39_007145 [Legionella anisa]|uniref:Uncharacterized protein n=1 Tax=Legionella anisa TaxID=28082 RepID=A0AAX0WUS6_9GAMM|nr:hypothetical protein DLD14_14995 [Legionella anisa]PNL61006.1 hypothetical protein A6J39_007145 [Legionella anisa]
MDAALWCSKIKALRLNLANFKQPLVKVGWHDKSDFLLDLSIIADSGSEKGVAPIFQGAFISKV